MNNDCQCDWCNKPIRAGSAWPIERGRDTFYFHNPREQVCATNWIEQERRLEKAFNGTI